MKYIGDWLKFINPCNISSKRSLAPDTPSHQDINNWKKHQQSDALYTYDRLHPGHESEMLRHWSRDVQATPMNVIVYKPRRFVPASLQLLTSRREDVSGAVNFYIERCKDILLSLWSTIHLKTNKFIQSIHSNS